MSHYTEELMKKAHKSQERNKKLTVAERNQLRKEIGDQFKQDGEQCLVIIDYMEQEVLISIPMAGQIFHCKVENKITTRMEKENEEETTINKTK